MMRFYPILASLLLVACASPSKQWKTIDEGFTFSVPTDFRKRNVTGIDSHVGEYRGNRIYLEFDHVNDMLFSKKDASESLSRLALQSRDSSQLKPGEEIWMIDGHLARFSVGPADRETYGSRRFHNVAKMFVPFTTPPSAIKITAFYKEEADLSTVKRIFKSFRWKTKRPNQTMNSTARTR